MKDQLLAALASNPAKALDIIGDIVAILKAHPELVTVLLGWFAPKA